MRLTLSRVGGFAGIAKPPLVIETTRLPSEDVQLIVRLVSDADFFSLPEELKADRIDPDSFAYTLTIVGETGEEHSVSFTDRSLEGAMRELVTTVRRLSSAS